MIEPTPRQVHWAVKAFLWAGPVSVVGDAPVTVRRYFTPSCSTGSSGSGAGEPDG